RTSDTPPPRALARTRPRHARRRRPSPPRARRRPARAAIAPRRSCVAAPADPRPRWWGAPAASRTAELELVVAIVAPLAGRELQAFHPGGILENAERGEHVRVLR